jgi:hypothetical protein
MTACYAGVILQLGDLCIYGRYTHVPEQQTGQDMWIEDKICHLYGNPVAKTTIKDQRLQSPDHLQLQYSNIGIVI